MPEDKNSDTDLSKSLQEAQDSLSDFVSSTGNLAKSLTNEITRNSLDLVHKISDNSHLWGTNPDENLGKDSADSLEEAFDGIFNNSNRLGFGFSPFSKDEFRLGFPHGFRGRAGSVPSLRKYDRCMENNGLSVWDKSGHWQCLFPRSVLNNNYGADNGTISKEDYLEDKNGAKGSFFENFNDLLGWKSQMRKLQRAEKLKMLQQRKDKFTRTWDFSESAANSVQEKTEDDDKIVGTSKSYSTRTTEDGSIEKYSKVMKWYGDGSSKIEETKKIIPADGSDPKTETSVKSLGPNESDKSGWFWDS